MFNLNLKTMKRDLQKLFAILAVFSFSFCLLAQTPELNPNERLKVDFENGIPADWTQENVNGAISWVAESGELSFPNGAYSGQSRVAFRGDSISTNARTRLISPQMDITSIYQPILVFAHAQSTWTNDFDTLRVLYRASADKEWTLLKTFDRPIKKWAVDTVRLNGGSRTYQIAFEATDNLGRGVVIDDVLVRSTPRCIDPYGLIDSKVTNESVELSWMGEFDAKFVKVKVSTTQLSAEQLASDSIKANVLDTTIVGPSFGISLEKLNAGTKYYYYVRTLCGVDVSDWVGAEFRTSNLIYPGYTMNFNNRSVGTTYPLNCYVGSSENVTSPYINTTASATEKAQLSPDASTVVCFNGAVDKVAATAIPANSYAYFSLPQMEVGEGKSMSDLFVSFTAINYTPNNSDRNSIVVGVMTDPNDFGSFEALDTVNITSMRVFEKCFVSLEKYQGEGKFIAFASNFSESNIFVMDNLLVDFRPEVLKVNNFQMQLPSATQVLFNFPFSYEKYEVVLSKTELTADELATATAQEITNGGALTVEPTTLYFVYARGVNGSAKGEWSDRRILRTPGRIESVPYTVVTTGINREDATTFYPTWYENSQIETGGALIPSLLTLGNSTAMFKINESLTIRPLEATVNKTVGTSWTALVSPELGVDLKNTRLTFELMTSIEQSGAVVVGVMSDARDFTTFQPVDTFKAETSYIYHYIDFVNYDVNGKFVAFLVSTDNVELDKNTVRINKIKFDEMPSCGNVVNIQAMSPSDPSRLIISWDKTTADAWVVRVAKNTITYEGIDSRKEWFTDDTITTNSIEITGLDGPGYKYYYTIKALCDTTLGVFGEWSYPVEFETGCFDVQAIPYSEDFENPHYRSRIGLGGFPVPCMYTQQVAYLEMNYPVLTVPQNASSYGILMRKNPSMGNPMQNLYLALPKMAKPLNELQLSFDMMLQSGKVGSVTVGVMTDPYDSTTIEEVAVIKTKTQKEFLKYIVTFENYKGNGEHIVISLNDGCELSWDDLFLAIDNINVDYIATCPRPEDLKVVSYDSDRVNLRWTSSSKVSKWRVMLTTKRLNEFEISDILEGKENPNVFKFDTVTTNPAEIVGLNTNTEYHAYVQPLCDAESGLWSNPVKFRTPCEVVTVDKMGTNGVEGFENYIKYTYSDNYKYLPECWTVGTLYEGPVDEGYDINSYIPYCDVKTQAGYAHTGSSALLLMTLPPYNGAYAITNRIDISDISKIYMKFWGSCKSYSSDSYLKKLVVGVVTDPTDLSTFEAVDTLSFVEEWRPYEVRFDNYECDLNGDRGKYVMFLSNFEIKNGVRIDDVVFDTVPSCMTKLAVDSIGIESIKVTLSGGGAPYQVKYATALATEDILNGNTLDSVVSYDNSTLVIPGLRKATTYYVYARSTCDGGYTAWTTVETITTDCPRTISLPFFDNFEDQPNLKNTPPVCYYSHCTASTSKYPYMYGVTGSYYYPSGGNKSTHALYFTVSKTGTTYLVTPEVEVESLSRCKVSFHEYNGTTNKRRNIIVGAVSDINDIPGTFEPIDTVIFDTYPNNYLYTPTVSLEGYKGTAKHIAFTTSYALTQKYSTSKKVWQAETSACYFTIDDIKIEKIPTCFPGEKFAMLSHTDNSLTISFTHEGAPQYEVKYGPVGFNRDSEGTSLIIDATTFTIAGLAANTEYDVYVRTLCAADDISEWGKAGTFRTAPEVVTNMPYNFNFTDESEAAKWLFAQNGQVNQWFIGTDDAQVVSDKGGKALYISNDSAKSAHYNPDVVSYSWASRAVALEAGVYTVSYDWTCFGEDKNDYVRVGFLPTTSRFNGGSATITNLDGTAGALGNALTENRIQGWIDLSNSTGLNGVDTTKAMAEQWQTKETVVFVTPEMAGLYNMVFYWVNNDTIGEYAAKRSAVIDNISITRESCTPPHEFKLISVNSNEAKIAIASVNSTESYEVVAFADTLDVATVTEANVAFHKQENNDTVVINGLTAGVNYKVYARAICSTTDNSRWAGPFEVSTSCNPIAMNTVLTMDDENEHYSIGGQSSLTEQQNVLPSCFVGGRDNSLASIPSLAKNAANVKYARSGEYALRLYSTNNDKNDATGGFVTLPEVNADFSITQLSFWMRCVTNDTLGKVTTSNVGTTYARKITVGSMTNPYDPTTFVAFGTFEYPYTATSFGLAANISSDATGNDYWIQVSVPLADAAGPFIAFKDENYGFANNIVYIDDIVFEQISCFTPNNLVATEISSNSVTIDCRHSDAVKYVLQYATNTNFTGAVVDTVAALPARISNLDASTAYYVKVQTICAEGDTSEWSPYYMFQTNKTTPYAESFDRISSNLDGWQTSNTYLASQAFAGQAEFAYSGLSSDTWITQSGIFAGLHLKANIINPSGLNDSSKGTKSWLFSPVVDLTDATANYHLMFDLALTDMDKTTAPTEEDKNDTDDKFMVIVSEDAGDTWKQENATIWGTATDNYQYYSIPSTGKRYEVDLTKYAGKQIRVAFYVESNNPGATTTMHIDNVHINACVTDIIDYTICETEDFANDYFNFEGNQLNIGENSHRYWELTTEVGKVDIFRGVNISVLPKVETRLTDQICESDVYALNNFPSLTAAGRYKQKIRSANGCDSIVILELSVIPTEHTTTVETICSGQVYNWNGIEYTEGGVYSETLVSSLGCDSLVTLVLQVTDPIREEVSVNICFGETYEFGELTINSNGNYEQTFKTAEGCDSIVLLHATVLPDYRSTLNETIKSGEKYNDNGFEGLSKSGVYTLKLESVDGCDSTVVLNLTVLEGDTSYFETTITTDELPYTYETLYYDENTKPGVYIDTLVLERDGEEYVIIHTLTVEEGTAVDVVRNFDLIMVPNPVFANHTLYINADFTIEEREGLMVEVFNAVGQRIYVDTPTIYPIGIDGLNTTGVYVVRVITGNGKSYQGKVIVE